MTYPQGYIISSLKNIIRWYNFVLKFYFTEHYFTPFKTFRRKGKAPEPDPHLWLMDPDPVTGGPKTCGSCGSGFGSQSGSPTLVPGNKNRLHHELVTFNIRMKQRDFGEKHKFVVCRESQLRPFNGPLTALSKNLCYIRRPIFYYFRPPFELRRRNFCYNLAASVRRTIFYYFRPLLSYAPEISAIIW